MSAFEVAKEENGIAVVDGVTYAVFERPLITNLGSGVAYKAIGFRIEDMNEDNGFDPLLDSHVTLLWDCTEWYNSEDSADDWDGDWLNGATVK